VGVSQVNNNYIILQKVEVIDDTMESCWYDIDYFEIEDCSICSNNKECKDFKLIKQEGKMNLAIGKCVNINGNIVKPIISNDCENCALEKECSKLKFACYVGSEPIKFLKVIPDKKKGNYV